MIVHKKGSSPYSANLGAFRRCGFRDSTQATKKAPPPQQGPFCSVCAISHSTEIPRKIISESGVRDDGLMPFCEEIQRVLKFMSG